MDSTPLVSIELTPDEREILASGLNEWEGPALCTEELAVAMGFDGTIGLLSEAGRIGNAIRDSEALSQRDWVRALLATEIAFVSDVVGSGHDWSITVGVADGRSIELIRTAQNKILRDVPVRAVLSQAIGTVLHD